MQTDPGNQSREPEQSGFEPSFSLLQKPPVRRLFVYMAAGFCVQSLALGVLSAFPFLGLCLAVAVFGILCWRFARLAGELAREANRSLRPRIHLVPSIVMALILAFFGWRSELGVGGGSGGGSGSRSYEEKEIQLGKNDSGQSRPARPGDSVVPEDTQPGVILVLEPKEHTTLVPPMPAIGEGSVRLSPTKPLAIPFYGVYHFFRKRDGQLPSNSQQRQGSPSELRFRSTDNTPINMEAHQNLGTFIDVACCSGIQVAIVNADTYAWTVGLELILVNTESKQKESLGIAPVTSTLSWRPARDERQVSEFLSFRMPDAFRLRRFDEIAARFHLSQLRAERSAKISIEKFLLIPRGL